MFAEGGDEESLAGIKGGMELLCPDSSARAALPPAPRKRSLNIRREQNLGKESVITRAGISPG